MVSGWLTLAVSPAPHDPGFAATSSRVSTVSVATSSPSPPGLKRRTTSAWPPPLAKKSSTAYDIGPSDHRPPKRRPNSPKLLQIVGCSTAPRAARPTKAVIEVATPVIVRTPDETSCTYTPG